MRWVNCWNGIILTPSTLPDWKRWTTARVQIHDSGWVSSDTLPPRIRRGLEATQVWNQILLAPLSRRIDRLGRGGSQIAGLLAKLRLLQGFPKASGKWLCRCFRWTLENFLTAELRQIRVNLLVHKTNQILLWRHAVQMQAWLPTEGGVSWFPV